mgnify:CR=1 FL=1
MPSFDHLVELFDEVDHHTRRHRARGPKGALYHGCSGDALDCEALAFVGEAVPQTDRIRLYQLPAVEVASVVHAGPVLGAAAAYEALSAWVAGNGLELAGASLELYLGGQFADAESVIEIQFPLRARDDSDVH